MNKTFAPLVLLTAMWMPNSCGVGNSVEGTAYYVSADGHDQNSGLSADQAWVSIDRVNAQSFFPGDTVYFRAGDEFRGTLMLSSDDEGTFDQRLVLTSHGQGKARIHGLDSLAVWADACDFLTLENLEFLGNGRNSGNATRRSRL